RLGSLMRHFLPAAVAGLAGRVAKAAGPAVLIAAAGVVQRPAPRVRRARRRAVPLPAVTPTAEKKMAPTGPAAAHDRPQRIHALPRSGRGGWTTTVRRAKKGAASRALPWCDPPEGPGWLDSGPSPLGAVGGTAVSQLTLLAQPHLEHAPVGNSALPH